MKESKFLHDVLSKGAILGFVMLASCIFEQAVLIYKGTLGWVGFMGIEMLVIAGVFVWLIYRFTKNYSRTVLDSQQGIKYFSYGSGLGYAVVVSMLAGVIVAIGTYIFRHSIVGYDNYTDGMIQTYQNLLSASNMPASMAGTYRQMFAQLKSQPEPSLFMSLFSGISNYFISGTLVGLVVAGLVKHTPDIFNDKTGDAE